VTQRTCCLATTVALVATVVVACGQADQRRSNAPAPATTPTAEKATAAGADLAETKVQKQAVDRLLAFENQARRNTDFGALPPAAAVTGANPSDVVSVPGTDRYVGALAGSGAVALLDRDGNELARAPAPFRPVALAMLGPDTVLAAGGSSDLAMFRVSGDSLERTESLEVPNAVAIADVIAGPDGAIYAADEFTGAIAMRSGANKAGAWREIARCHGPRDLIRTPRMLVVNCLLDHEVRAWRVDTAGVPRGPSRRLFRHDGPLWSLAAIETGGTLRIAATGVEDRPLDRSDGGFAFIDSFLYLYEATVDRGKADARRLAAINTSEHGVVVPKSVRFATTSDAPGQVVVAYAYASSHGLAIDWKQRRPRVVASLPGVAAVAGDGERGALLGANPLLDGWVRFDRADLVPVSGNDPRSVESRVGEALFFTTLMAPWSPAEGRRSRFTCETCHFRGYGDGRVHYTGRGDVHASTKALLGLFNNRPHFSRALDKTMAEMVHAEFRVANKHNGRSPWFELARDDFPWLRYIEGVPGTMSPEFLRRSFMSWLMDFTYSPNPAVAGRSSFSELERRGATVFRGNCAMCHSPRLVADKPDSAVPFERWESYVFSDNGPLLWARSDYRNVGVKPLVHEQGARVPSLRRLYTKYPYFTNGSAQSLTDVLDQIRFGDNRNVWHANAPANTRKLTPDQRKSLTAFLRLL